LERYRSRNSTYTSAAFILIIADGSENLDVILAILDWKLVQRLYLE